MFQNNTCYSRSSDLFMVINTLFRRRKVIFHIICELHPFEINNEKLLIYIDILSVQNQVILLVA